MSPRPTGGFAGREIIIVALIMGALAALMIPAYLKVRQSSEDKAVMCPIRQLSAAADQYFLENGVSTVALRDLVGATNYVKALNPVGQEIYPMIFTRGITITVTGVGGSRTVTYAP